MDPRGCAQLPKEYSTEHAAEQVIELDTPVELCYNALDSAEVKGGGRLDRPWCAFQMTHEGVHVEEPGQQVVAFASKRGVGLINADGRDERYPEFGIPGQASWQLGQLFADGRRMIVQSIEDVTMSKLVVGEVQTHTWIYDLGNRSLQEILTEDRVAPYMGCCGLLPGEDRMVVAAVIDGEQRLFTMDLDGGNQNEITRPGQGFHYGVALSPEGRRLAFHLTRSKYDKVSGPTQ